MLLTATVIAFVATTDADAAREFYGDVLGLHLISDDLFALVFDANGTMLRVQKVEQLDPARFTVLGWDVADIHATVEELQGRGVTFNEYPGLNQEGYIWTAPGGARIAWFSDPAGNTLSLTQG